MNSTQTNAKKSRKYQRHKVAKQLLTRSHSHKKNAYVRMCVQNASSIVKRCFFFSSLSFKKKNWWSNAFRNAQIRKNFFFIRGHIRSCWWRLLDLLRFLFLALKNCDDEVIWLTSFSFNPPKNIFLFYFLLAKKLFA